MPGRESVLMSDIRPLAPAQLRPTYDPNGFQ